jgi:hypothetical protein
MHLAALADAVDDGSESSSMISHVPRDNPPCFEDVHVHVHVMSMPLPPCRQQGQGLMGDCPMALPLPARPSLGILWGRYTALGGRGR